MNICCYQVSFVYFCLLTLFLSKTFIKISNFVPHFSRKKNNIFRYINYRMLAFLYPFLVIYTNKVLRDRLNVNNAIKLLLKTKEI